MFARRFLLLVGIIATHGYMMGARPQLSPGNTGCYAQMSGAKAGEQGLAMTRRSALTGAAAAAAGISAGLWPSAAFAKQDDNDLSRLQKGLQDINKLLDNWDVETVDPVSGADSPDRVRFFLGLRTTDHPLFQIDKLINKAGDRVDDARFEDWVAATEGFNSAVAKVNELAYTSSFGEYNPGGGKEQVRKYLLLAKEEVVVAKKSLETMITLLGL